MAKTVIAAGRIEKRNGKVADATVTANSWLCAAVSWGKGRLVVQKASDGRWE